GKLAAVPPNRHGVWRRAALGRAAAAEIWHQRVANNEHKHTNDAGDDHQRLLILTKNRKRTSHEGARKSRVRDLEGVRKKLVPPRGHEPKLAGATFYGRNRLPVCGSPRPTTKIGR